MYIEYEVHDIDDFVDLIRNEAFKHLTKAEARNLILKLIDAYFDEFRRDLYD